MNRILNKIDFNFYFLIILIISLTSSVLLISKQVSSPSEDNQGIPTLKEKTSRLPVLAPILEEFKDSLPKDTPVNFVGSIYHSDNINLNLRIGEGSVQQLLYNNRITFKIESAPDWTTHLPIKIQNNSDFINQASIEGWNANGRDGSMNNPFLIANYFIGNSSNYGVLINGTDLYFIIDNVYVNNSASNGFFLYNVTNGFLSNNIASNNSNNGYYLLFSTKNTFINNIGSQNGNSGILTDNSNNNYFENNSLMNNSKGVYVWSSTNNDYYSNNIEKNQLYGFHIWYADNNTIKNNYIGNSTGVNIYLQQATNNMLIGNIVNKSNMNGFLLEYSENNRIINNFVYNEPYAFYLYNSNYNQLSTNIVNQTSQFGYFLEGSLYNTLSNNLANFSNTYGFYLQSSNSNIFNGNTAENSYIGFELEGSHNNYLGNNIARFSSQDGFRTITCDYNVFENNMAMNNIYFGYTLDGSSNANTLTGNLASNNGDSGFYLNYAYNTILSNNNASGSFNGFYIVGSTGTIIDNNYAEQNFQGLDLYYSNNNFLTNNLFNNNTIYGLILTGAENNQLINNTAMAGSNIGIFVGASNNFFSYSNVTSNKQHGFFIAGFTMNNIVEYSIAYKNGKSGFTIEGGQYLQIRNNIAELNNEHGFWIYPLFRDSIAEYNVAYNNLQDGFHVTVYQNITFIENFAQDNQYYDYYLENMQGFEINGGSIESKVFLDNCTEVTVDVIEGTKGTINYNFLNIIKPYQTYAIYLNGLLRQNGVVLLTQTNISIDYADILPGQYEVTLLLFEGITQIANETLYLNVIDIPGPMISSPSDVSFTEGSTNNTVTWDLLDPVVSSYAIYLNDIKVFEEISPSEMQITFNLDNLYPGYYLITLVAFGDYGQSTSDTVFITVNYSQTNSQIETTFITNTVIETSFIPATTTEIIHSTDTETKTTIIQSQTLETTSKTTTGFEIVFITVGFLGLLLIKKNRKR